MYVAEAEAVLTLSLKVYGFWVKTLMAKEFCKIKKSYETQHFSQKL